MTAVGAPTGLSRDTASSSNIRNGQMSRDGALVTWPWKIARVAEGRGFHVDVGAFSTPITGGGNGTVIDLDQPEFALAIPDGTAIMPIRIDVAVLPGLQTTDSHETEILIAADVAAVAASDGTATAETILNMRSDGPITSNCTAKSAYTADLTDPTLGMELAHAAQFTDVQGTAATVNMYQLPLLYEPETPPIIHGPAGLFVYWGGSIAATGFAQVEWLEFPESMFA